LCSVLCSLHDFVSLVDRRPDLLQAGMLVQTGNVHFAVAHDIHHGHYIACSVHRIGSESVPGTIEHNGLGQTCQLFSAGKLLLHRLDMARSTASQREDEARLLLPPLQCFLDAFTQRHVPLRFARLAALFESFLAP